MKCLEVKESDDVGISLITCSAAEILSVSLIHPLKALHIYFQSISQCHQLTLGTVCCEKTEHIKQVEAVTSAAARFS